MAQAGKFLDDVISGVRGAGNVLKSNDAINKIGTNMGGAFEYVNRGLRKGDWDAMKTFGKVNADGKAVNAAGKVLAKGEKQALNYGKIAGSYIGATAAVRVAAGGGLYRDKNGNTDVAGIPFI